MDVGSFDATDWGNKLILNSELLRKLEFTSLEFYIIIMLSVSLHVRTLRGKSNKFHQEQRKDVRSSKQERVVSMRDACCRINPENETSFIPIPSVSRWRDYSFCFLFPNPDLVHQQLF